MPDDTGLHPAIAEIVAGLGARAMRPARPGEEAPAADPAAWLAGVNTALAAAGMPPHAEPPDVPPFRPIGPDSIPFLWLHLLRRAGAHVRIAGPAPLAPATKLTPEDDALIARAATPEAHLLWHSDCDGVYLPRDFPAAVEDGRGGAVGSAVRLAAELDALAPAIGIDLRAGALPASDMARIAREPDDAPPHAERQAWLLLRQAATQSLRTGAAIVFC